MTWQIKKLGEVLEYEQPTQYIVSSKNYKEEYETPVLTAGKSFVLGKTKEKNGIFPKDKLPVIIFDDFTTATKFVDFPFKVKSSAMKILHSVKNKSDAKFLFYLMQNISFDHAGIHKRYWISEYSQIEILLPPLPEQHRIVKILDEVFDNVKKAKENTEKNLQNSKDLFESYLNNIFTNPKKDWDEKVLSNVSDFQNGFAFKSALFKTGGFPILRISNIQDDGISYKRLVFFDKASYKENFDKYQVSKGDLVIAMSGATTGKLAISNADEIFFLNQRVGKFLPKRGLLKQFLYYYLSTRIKENLRISAGAAQPNLSTEQIKNFIIPLPSFEEQKSIVAKLDSLFAQTKKLEEIYKQKLTDLEGLKKSVLKKAFSGGL